MTSFVKRRKAPRRHLASRGSEFADMLRDNWFKTCRMTVERRMTAELQAWGRAGKPVGRLANPLKKKCKKCHGLAAPEEAYNIVKRNHQVPSKKRPLHPQQLQLTPPVLAVGFCFQGICKVTRPNSLQVECAYL